MNVLRPIQKKIEVPVQEVLVKPVKVKIQESSTRKPEPVQMVDQTPGSQPKSASFEPNPTSSAAASQPKKKQKKSKAQTAAKSTSAAPEINTSQAAPQRAEAAPASAVPGQQQPYASPRRRVDSDDGKWTTVK